MVRRLLQGLDQVVSILWIYRPEGTFAYALKERKKEEEEKGGERCYWKCVESKLQTRCRGSRHRAQSSEPDLYTQARIALGGMIIITSPLPSHSTFPFLSAARKGKKSGELFSD